MTRISRVKIPATFATLKVDTTKDGALITLGSTHLYLSREKAMSLADALVDAAETKETP